MRKFKVFVEGRNFLIAGPDGSAAKNTFLTCRFVEAADPEGAENAAIEQLRSRETLKEMTLNDAHDPPMMYVTGIEEIASFEGMKSLNQGLIWYAEDESDDGEGEPEYYVRET